VVAGAPIKANSIPPLPAGDVSWRQLYTLNPASTTANFDVQAFKDPEQLLRIVVPVLQSVDAQKLDHAINVRETRPIPHYSFRPSRGQHKAPRFAQPPSHVPNLPPAYIVVIIKVLTYGYRLFALDTSVSVELDHGSLPLNQQQPLLLKTTKNTSLTSSLRMLNRWSTELMATRQPICQPSKVLRQLSRHISFLRHRNYRNNKCKSMVTRRSTEHSICLRVLTKPRRPRPTSRDSTDSPPPTTVEMPGSLSSHD
jgi:hypothetical protein